MEVITQREVFSLFGADFNEFIALPSIGASGGILVAWRSNVQVTGR